MELNTIEFDRYDDLVIIDGVCYAPEKKSGWKSCGTESPNKSGKYLVRFSNSDEFFIFYFARVSEWYYNGVPIKDDTDYKWIKIPE